jgi:predicted anti-sigma-YlaC factor YlaD
MECTRVREAISARLDGEEPGIAPARITAHVRRCGPCRAFRDRAESMPGSLPRIVDNITRPREPLVEWPVRVALFGLALAQLALAVPDLFFGSDEGAPVHIAHEVGSWDVALAIGFIFVAWRPLRAVGMLPFVTALSCMLITTAALDLLHGHAEAVFETTHLLTLVGSVLLWYLARPMSPKNFTMRAKTREPFGAAERPM